MRKLREILRLRAAGKSQRQIGLSVGIGQSTVGDALTRARLAGVSWPSELDDAALDPYSSCCTFRLHKRFFFRETFLK